MGYKNTALDGEVTTNLSEKRRYVHGVMYGEAFKGLDTRFVSCYPSCTVWATFTIVA